jgi:uncharacterized protein YndB with AHSA1/START domain
VAEPLRKSVQVRAAPERVFRTFTERLDSWWPASHRTLPGSVLSLEPGAGGRLLERTSGEEAQLGTILEWEPPSRLVYTWRLGSPPGLHTVVQVTFTPEGDGTRVDVLHTEGTLGGEFPTRAPRFDRAWDQVLPALVAAGGMTTRGQAR